MPPLHAILKHTLRANTHGYFYELFIKQLIARYASTSVAINILTTYLSHLAQRMHELQVKHIEEAEFRKLHGKLQDEFEVLSGFSDEVKKLIEMQILFKRNDSYKFKQPYIYYYFLALYLHNHINESNVGATIAAMARELFKEENASTLLFLSHFTKDKRILETLLASCESQFSGVIPITLDEDVRGINQLGCEIETVAIHDAPLPELRNFELERLEQEKNREIEYEDAHRDELESHNTLLGQLNAGIKTIQILGQYLKNFPANLGKSEKDQIITAAAGLASRILGANLLAISQNREQSIQDFMEMIARARPGLQRDKLREKAVNALVILSEWAATGMIWRLAQSLGSSELMNTFDRYFGEQESSFKRLVLLTLKLDHNESFPEAYLNEICIKNRANPFVYRLMQKFVARRLFMFPADFKLKQKLGNLLKLDYKKLQVPRNEERLIK